MARLTPEQRALVEGNMVVVATIGKDGGPRATPVWVDIRDDEHLVFNTAVHRGWPKNLRRDPRMAVTAYDRVNPFRNVAITGRVSDMTEEGGWEHIQELSRRYSGGPYEGARDRLIVTMDIDTTRSYGF